MKHLKLIGKILLIILIILSLGFNGYYFFQGYRTRLINAGADAMLLNVMNNIKTNGSVTITVPPDTITLVPGEAPAKKDSSDEK